MENGRRVRGSEWIWFLFGGICFGAARGLLHNPAHPTVVRHKSRKQLVRMACTDSLTGLLNQGSTRKRISRYLNQEGKRGVHGFILLDLNDFKKINDTKGHLYGDRLIRRLAYLLKGMFRSSDIIGRAGGDEFIILFKDVRKLNYLRQKLELLSGRIRQLSDGTYAEGGISSSIGAALYPVDGETFNQLYQKADQALYACKREPDSRYVFYGQK